MKQIPQCGEYILKWNGDELKVQLDASDEAASSASGNRAFFRCNLSGYWTDIPMEEVSGGRFEAKIPLVGNGVFAGKCCFFRAGAHVPEWPQGENLHIKVMASSSRSGNSIYTVFPRQFGSYRKVKEQLPHIIDRMGFGIVQTLPPFPVPVTYAVMGEYGCPFAATDFLSVDPAMAEFDKSATPLDQFRELIDGVHAHGGRFFMDLPANHTGWASALQTHHPEWFKRDGDGKFISPGAWGVVWADLVELDYANAGLREYMTEVFLFWCRMGVDGFRCDAGYMIPQDVWEHIASRVREQYPDTAFMLEGLGGELKITDALLAEAGLDWAYSELFQTYDRAQFEWYLPSANARAEKYGTLVHFAETHDNDRLAKGGETYAGMRVALSALLSYQGAWGITNGVEWFADEKIDVHGRNSLNWGARKNMVDLIARLNRVLNTCPTFSGNCTQKLIQSGEGNFLAVSRDDEVLVLVNLDCNNPVKAHWSGEAFPDGEYVEMVSGERMQLHQGQELNPGGFLCCAKNVRAAADSTLPGETTPVGTNAIEWNWPEDVRREVCVPEGMKVQVKCAYPHRMLICDGTRAIPGALKYSGDGTRAKRFTIEVTAFTPEGVKRTTSALLVPPPVEKAMAKLTVGGDEIRADHTLRTCLSNGAGADAFLPLAWGEIRSQYDSFLSANPDPECPSDRVVVWSRCRAWLQYQGYSHEIDASSIENFRADPSGRFALWSFSIPTGMGHKVPITFQLDLASGENAARLTISRTDAANCELDDVVRIVLRPDFECRSFHSTTKAFTGEAEICRRIAENVAFEVHGGEFHPDGEWSYSIAHPDEAERAQEPSGDVYSPGWAAYRLKAGDTANFVCAYGETAMKRAWFSDLPVPSENVMPIVDELKEAMKLYLVKRNDLKTVIAGYPWFLDWGRDTFIFLRGAIEAGMTDEAMKILQAFAEFEENGTLPNIIYGRHAGNRDTVDAQLWFILCVKELQNKNWMIAEKFKPTIESILGNYVKGTPNGIRMDPESALIWTPSHFTWMDTNYPACTPRCGYPVEIQALWINALRFAGGEWNALADKAEASVKRYFQGENGYADTLDATNGEAAKDARADFSLRPNQLMLVSLGVLKDESIVRACSKLVVPGGIRSLDSADVKYHGRYTGDEDTSRKPAYHNGTVWGWVMPSFAEAAIKSGVLTIPQALAIVSGVVENLNTGCMGHISEIADGDAPHSQKGCRAQAWSVSECYRVLSRYRKKI